MQHINNINLIITNVDVSNISTAIFLEAKLQVSSSTLAARPANPELRGECNVFKASAFC